MKQINGKFNSAKVFTDTIDPVAEEQIKTLCNQEFTQGSLIRVMPDVHAGAGCTIGTTMTVKDKIVPNLVGVDIGCGMATYVLREKEIDPEKLDGFIRSSIPAGIKSAKRRTLILKTSVLKSSGACPASTCTESFTAWARLAEATTLSKLIGTTTAAFIW